MEKMQYVCPAIKQVVMEDLMDPGIHNSVGNGEQLGNEAQYEEEQPVAPSSFSVWD